jgi:hypothetical protein
MHRGKEMSGGIRLSPMNESIHRPKGRFKPGLCIRREAKNACGKRERGIRVIPMYESIIGPKGEGSNRIMHRREAN